MAAFAADVDSNGSAGDGIVLSGGGALPARDDDGDDLDDEEEAQDDNACAIGIAQREALPTKCLIKMFLIRSSSSP